MSRTESTQSRSEAGQSSGTEVPRQHTTTASEQESQGSISIAPQVVQKIVALATREMTGIHAMGGGGARAYGAVRERIPGSGTTQTPGVRVEVGRKQAAIDLEVTVEYGTSLVELTRAVRRNVITAVETLAGLEVTEVNIAVNDVHVPSEGAEQQEAPARAE